MRPRLTGNPTDGIDLPSGAGLVSLFLCLLSLVITAKLGPIALAVAIMLSI